MGRRLAGCWWAVDTEIKRAKERRREAMARVIRERRGDMTLRWKDFGGK